MQYQNFISVKRLFLTVLFLSLFAFLSEAVLEASETETQLDLKHVASIILSGFGKVETEYLDVAPYASCMLDFDVTLSPQLHNRDLNIFYIGVLIAVADTYKGEIGLISRDNSHQKFLLQAIDSPWVGDYYANTRMVPAVSSHDVSSIFNIHADQPGYHFYQMMLPSYLYCHNARELHPQSGEAVAENGLYYGDQISVRCNFQFRVDMKSDHVQQLFVYSTLTDRQP